MVESVMHTSLPTDGEHGFDSRTFLGVTVATCNRDDAIRHLVRRLKFRQKTLVAFANTNLINAATRQPDLRTALRSFFVLNDGIGLDLASWVKYSQFFPENLNGTDFTPELLRACKGHRVFLYGSELSAVEGAASWFEANCDVAVVGYEHGFIEDADVLFERVNAARAEIVLVALGNPKQERWIFKNRERVNAPLMIGVGALFDYVSGDKQRAPAWVQKARLEWAARLMREPRRLAKRYTSDIARFFFAVVKESLSEQGPQRPPRR